MEQSLSVIDKAIESNDWNQEAINELNNIVDGIENEKYSYKRILWEERDGFKRGRRIHESASVILGRNSKTISEKYGDKSGKRKESPIKRHQRREQQGKEQERIIEFWAKI